MTYRLPHTARHTTGTTKDTGREANADSHAQQTRTDTLQLGAAQNPKGVFTTEQSKVYIKSQ